MYKTLSYLAPGYPKLFKEIPDHPKQLYYKGTITDELFTNCLAVIGSRKATSYGKVITEKLVKECVKYGLTIVSGFTYGIDEGAHRAALSVGGKTIAVVPFGIDYMKLGTRYNLYTEIIATGGLILSEYPGDYGPQKWMFVQRNRIVAGLCQAILVIEAAVSSGTFITVSYGRTYNRKILAVPGPITSKYSEGTLKLLREGETMVQGVDDILKALGIKKQSVADTSINNKAANPFVDLLTIEPLTLDDLADKTNLTISQLSQELSMLLIEGLVQEKGGRYYAC